MTNPDETPSRSRHSIGFPPLTNPGLDRTLIAGVLDEVVLEGLRDLEAQAAPRDWTRRSRSDGSRIGRVSGWTLGLDLVDAPGRSLVEHVVRLAVAANTSHHRFDCDRVSPDDPPFLLRLEHDDLVVPGPDLVEAWTTRKLTVVVRVSDTATRVGGVVGFMPGGAVDLAVGQVMIAPSFAAWGIEPVVSGSATLLVLRLHGPPFR